MLTAIERFDHQVNERLERLRSPALDRIFYPLSSAADHSLLWLILGTTRALRKNDVKFAVRFAAAMGFESALTNGPIKTIFDRRRPLAGAVVSDPLPYGMHRPITSSFPSGHATAGFTAAVLLSRPGRRAPWFVLAAAVASSRVYVRMHFASDVIGGAVVGLVLGRLLRRWVNPDH